MAANVVCSKFLVLSVDLFERSNFVKYMRMMHVCHALSDTMSACKNIC